MLRLTLAGLVAGMLLAGCSSGARKPATASEPVATTPTPTTPKPAAAKPGADKGDPDSRFKAALALMKDKQNKEAQDAFAALAKDYPDFSGALTNLGILQANAKQRPDAVASFQRALRDNPKNVIAQNWLGTLQRENGEYALAERSYQAALAIDPNYAPAHLNLGVLYDSYLKRPNDALAQYREYQRITGGDRAIVTAWIKDIETGMAPAAAPSATPPTPSRPVAPAVAVPTGAVK